MIRMRDLSARFDLHCNKYTMCTVQNDQVPDILMGPFLSPIATLQNQRIYYSNDVQIN